MTPDKLIPFLMFQNGEAHEAMTFYTELFDDGEIQLEERFAEGEPGAGSIRQGIIRVAGRQIQCFDSPTKHAFDFTPSVSLFMRCDSEDEQQRIWAGLSGGGTVLMPMNDYGFGPFGWCNDRFGVSWQISLR